MSRVAFVVQRYGLEVNGGAELQCRLIAERMARHWDVEVLTTCAKDYVTWKNFYPPGEVKVNGVTVKRFSVDAERNASLFDRFYDLLYFRAEARKFLDGTKIDLKPKTGTKKIRNRIALLIFEFSLVAWVMEKIWMWLQGPRCRGLTKFLKSSKDQYDAVIFFTFVYATTYYNIGMVGKKSILIPEAHDDPCLKYKIFNPVFKAPRVILLNTVEELDLIESNYQFDDTTTRKITAVGLESSVDSSMSASDFLSKHSIVGSVLLYVGRIEVSKGCEELFSLFRIYLEETKRTDLTLVLIGKAEMPIPEHPQIRALGFVSEAEKWAAFSAATALVMPSPYESLSFVVLEAWRSGIPVLVNGKCDVLKGQCNRAKGGVAYHSYEEFRNGANKLLLDKEFATSCAKSGREYYEKNYAWEKIEQDYLDAVELIRAK